MQSEKSKESSNDISVFNLDRLPKVDEKLFGSWENHQLARPVIKSEIRYKPTWYAGTYFSKGKRRQCPGVGHTKVKQLNPGSLCLVADFVRLVKRGTEMKPIVRAKRERRFFCLSSICVSSFSHEFTSFTNIRSPLDIDVSLCNDESKRHISRELPNVRLK